MVYLGITRYTNEDSHTKTVYQQRAFYFSIFKTAFEPIAQTVSVLYLEKVHTKSDASKAQLCSSCTYNEAPASKEDGYNLLNNSCDDGYENEVQT